MTLGEILEKLKKFKGQFEFVEFEGIRHKSITDLVGAPACPLNILCAHLENPNNLVCKYPNWKQSMFEEKLEASKWDINKIIWACDIDDNDLHKKIVEILGVKNEV